MTSAGETVSLGRLPAAIAASPDRPLETLAQDVCSFPSLVSSLLAVLVMQATGTEAGQVRSTRTGTLGAGRTDGRADSPETGHFDPSGAGASLPATPPPK